MYYFFVPRYFVQVVDSAKNKKTFLIHRTETAFEAMSEKNSYRPKTIAILHIYELENSSYADRTSVIYIRELDTARRCTCMNDRAATDINSNVTTVAYNISRLCIRKTYLVSNTS